MRRAARIASLVVLFVMAFGVAWVRLPFYSAGPGPADEVAPRIDVQGVPRYGSEGRFIMTTVSFTQVTALESLFVWLDEARAIVSMDEVYPPGVDPDVDQRRSISQMDTSKISASIVVLRELFDYPQEHGRGALIAQVGADCPAEGELFVGDLVVAIEGQPVGSLREAQRSLDRVPVAEVIGFRVRAGGEVHDVELRRGPCPGSEEPLVGISMVDPFPFEIEISSGDVGGPSAGLMFSLGLYDTLTPDDLTGGRTIAGTGTLTPEGEVGPIGGIVDKVIGAEREDAHVFLVPAENMAELEGVDTGAMRLISVATFDEAVEALEALEAPQ
jgi:Lon-like protease